MITEAHCEHLPSGQQWINSWQTTLTNPHSALVFAVALFFFFFFFPHLNFSKKCDSVQLQILSITTVMLSLHGSVKKVCDPLLQRQKRRNFHVTS